MRDIRVTFTDAEFKQIKKIRKQVGLTWHDYIVEMAKMAIKIKRVKK